MNSLIPRSRSRMSPWQELETLQDRVNRLFGRPLPTLQLEEPMEWMPIVNLVEADDEFVLTAELPGMKPEDVEVDVEENVLTLKGEKKAEREEKEGRWHLMERTHGAFERCFTLPRTVEPDRIRADFENGLLRVHLPKRKESKGRKIEINGK